MTVTDVWKLLTVTDVWKDCHQHSADEHALTVNDDCPQPRYC